MNCLICIIICAFSTQLELKVSDRIIPLRQTSILGLPAFTADMPKAPCLSRKRKRKPKDFELVESRFFKKPVLLLPPPPPPPSPKGCPSSPRTAVTLASPQMDKAQPMIVRLVNSRPFLIQSGFDAIHPVSLGSAHWPLRPRWL